MLHKLNFSWGLYGYNHGAVTTGGQYFVLGRRNMSLKKGLSFCGLLRTIFLIAHCAPRVENAAITALRFYTGSTLNQFINFSIYDGQRLSLQIDNSKPTVFYIHGYSESLDSESVHTVVNAYLHRGDHNVIAVDWSETASRNYLFVALSGEKVGMELANTLNELVVNGLNQNSIHIVGHSMGAQISGYVGRNTNFKIPRITGLDPAGPGFLFTLVQLQASDAAFVDIIFTDAGMYGFPLATGSANFFPNGGRRLQPGCVPNTMLLSDEDFCSHHRSWRFYAESLLDENAFLGVRCNSYTDFLYGNCISEESIPMGFVTPTNSVGKFYLRTNSTSPFGLGQEGTEPN